MTDDNVPYGFINFLYQEDRGGWTFTDPQENSGDEGLKPEDHARFFEEDFITRFSKDVKSMTFVFPNLSVAKIFHRGMIVSNDIQNHGEALKDEIVNELIKDSGVDK
jgi:hypothetical protein|tara:strand:- start:328 stop:648 length:321 start_codon:yes stop_codon:yes gene_type:complete